MKNIHFILLGLLIVTLILGIITDPLIEGAGSTTGVDTELETTTNADAPADTDTDTSTTVDGGKITLDENGNKIFTALDGTVTLQPSCPLRCTKNQQIDTDNCQKVYDSNGNFTNYECSGVKAYQCATVCDVTDPAYEPTKCEEKYKNTLDYFRTCRNINDCKDCPPITLTHSSENASNSTENEMLKQLYARFNQYQAEQAEKGIDVQFNDWAKKQMEFIESGGDVNYKSASGDSTPGLDVPGTTTTSEDSVFNGVPVTIETSNEESSMKDDMRDAVKRHEEKYHPEANGEFYPGYGPTPRM